MVWKYGLITVPFFRFHYFNHSQCLSWKASILILLEFFLPFHGLRSMSLHKSTCCAYYGECWWCCCDCSWACLCAPLSVAEVLQEPSCILFLTGYIYISVPYYIWLIFIPYRSRFSILFNCLYSYGLLWAVFKVYLSDVVFKAVIV